MHIVGNDCHHALLTVHKDNTVMVITPRAHARSGVKQSVLSVSQSVSQSSVVCLSGEKN